MRVPTNMNNTKVIKQARLLIKINRFTLLRGMPWVWSRKAPNAETLLPMASRPIR